MSNFSVFQRARYTVFDTPVLSPFLSWTCRRVFYALGWRFAGEFPPETKKAVVIAAPHTSNWDLPYALMAAFAMGRKVHWLGKKQIFRFPFGGVMRWLGGIAVDRSRSGNLVDAAIACFRETSGSLLLIVPPEGTRSAVEQWKTGFYYIALGAKVPVVMAYMDHVTRCCGAAQLFFPTGSIETDMPEIRAYYAPFQGWAARKRQTTEPPKS